MNCNDIIKKLRTTRNAERGELIYLLENITDGEREVLRRSAQEVAQEHFGNKIYIRGLIEISSYCKNDCLYCGIRRSNKNAVRYRLTPDEILSCCEHGYELGFCTFVLQGGEDPYYTDDLLCELIGEIKRKCPGCAVTLSLGERSYESLQRLYDAGADRYLKLKEIGYQTGAGFMVGSPYQTAATLAEDLMFIKKLQPQMCGIGPFVPHKDTVFRDEEHGGLNLTLTLLSVIRLMNPDVLLPATTALGTIDPRGRELGILHGANVVMPNLSPAAHRKDYSLYDNKICTGEEAAECLNCLKGRMRSIGYEIVKSRGDYAGV